MSDSRFFSTTKRGEIQEFKQDLNAVDRGKKKDAVKKVIAAMTVGKDVSSLFPDVVNCMQTEDMELKKLVYLYLINYAKTQPDLTIMAVNTFVKDSQDPNPLIRALAVRTMGCIRVDRITEYLCDPLQRCLKDEDPYVRKTAAVCVAKLHDISPELVEERGFLEALKNLIGDANPMVVANAVAALSEIQDVSGRPVFSLDKASLTKLLRALNECTEWGQVFILDTVAGYNAVDSDEAETIIERVIPRLQHANAAVVLSAVKVILHNLDSLRNNEPSKAIARKLAPPLVTLLGAEPEIQYVALRCINLIVQRNPVVLAHEVRVFFCKYNDPIYVKIEKLEIMVLLATEVNIDQVLLEFKEYATEVDVDFVRRSVRAIGRCAIAIEAAAERCVNVLLDLMRTRVNYVVQEAVVVIKDIFRRYPNRYESVISTLCECLDGLDEPEARASMVWIVGEYAERIDNADELLEQFLESFPEEPPVVQLQLVTAAVKLFLKKPTERPQALIQLVLTYATQETDNPDLRDRAYIYWRLLSTDPDAAKDVVLAEKPVISDSREALDPALLDILLKDLGALSSVYHRPAEAFISRTRVAVQKAEDLEDARAKIFSDNASNGGSGLASQVVDESSSQISNTTTEPPQISNDLKDATLKSEITPDLLGDLLDLDVPVSQSTITAGGPSGVAGLLDDLSLQSSIGEGEAANAATSNSRNANLPLLLSAELGKGLLIRGVLQKSQDALVYNLQFQNVAAGQALDGFMIQFNKNSMGLAPASQVIPVNSINPGSTVDAAVKVVQSSNLMMQTPVSDVLQVAVRCNQLGVLYFTDHMTLDLALSGSLTIDGPEFVNTWKSIPESQELQHMVSVTLTDVSKVVKALENSKIFVLVHKKVGDEEVLYASSHLNLPGSSILLLMELRFQLGQGNVRLYCRCKQPEYASLFIPAIERTLLV